MAVEAYVNLPTPSAPTVGQPTLNGAILAGAVSLIVSSNTNVPAAAPFHFIIDDEIFLCSARPSLTWTVAGAQEGTTAANHANGATVVVAGVLTTASLKNNPLALTTTGDLPYLDSSGNQARLAVGAAGTVLVGGTIPAYSATPSSLTSVAIGLATALAPLHVSQGVSGYSAFTEAIGNVINTGAIVATAIDDTTFAGGATIFAGANLQVISNPAVNASRSVRALNLAATIPATNAIALANYTLQAMQARADYAGTSSVLTVRGATITGSSSGSGTLTSVIGATCTAQRTVTSGTGNVTNLQAGTFLINNANASGTVTQGAGVVISTLVNAGTITDTYGLLVGDITTGTQTNLPYSIYTTDTSARLQFYQAYSYFTFATGTYLLIGDANNSAHGSDKNQLIIANSSTVDSTTKYGNPVYQGRLQNPSATPTELALGEFGWEGDYTNTGIGTGTNVPHVYIWDAVNPGPVFPGRFVLLCHLAAGSPSEFGDTGVLVSSLFDKAQIGTNYGFATSFPLIGTPGAKTYSSVLVRPTFNLTDGASTTVNVLDVDTVNTSVTNLTVNLFKASYGATQRLKVDSFGQIIATTDIGSTLYSFQASRTSADTASPNNVFLKARGTIGSEAAINLNDVIGTISFRGFDGGTYSTYVSNSARIRAVATENFVNAGNRGAKLELATTTTTTAGLVTLRLTIDENGLTLADAHNIITGTGTGMKIGTGTTQKIGFYNATPVVQPTDGATLTNNVTSGGTTNQIDDFTSLTLYSTDAAAIRNNIYQLARKVKIITDNLRSLGLES